MSEAALRKTPLNAVHRALGAKMVDFGGWDMPVQYSGIIDEHNAVRNAVGLFDVSHMGEIEIRGPEAATLVDFVTTNHAAKLKLGQAHYSGLLYEHGGFVDDILVHKVADDHFFLCVNASNQDKDFEHIRAQNQLRRRSRFRERPLCATRRARAERAGYAAKADAGGSRRDQILLVHRWRGLRDAGAHRPHRLHRRGRLRNLCPAGEAERIWNEIMEAGAEFGIKPCGLGARNTLRLESKMALYGHEIDASISPLEADLGWIVKLDKGEFVGRDALVKQKEGGRHAQAGRVRNARPRHRPRRLRSAARRRVRPAG